VTHTPRTEGEEDQCDRESSGHTPCHTLPAQKKKKKKVVFNGRHVSRQPAKAVGTSDRSQSTRMKKQEKTVPNAARNVTVHNGSVCGSYC